MERRTLDSLSKLLHCHLHNGRMSVVKVIKPLQQDLILVGSHFRQVRHVLPLLQRRPVPSGASYQGRLVALQMLSEIPTK